MVRKTEQEWEVHRFPRESALQNYCLNRLRKLPKLQVTKTSDKFQAGISDFIICADGKYVAIELKVRSNKPTDLQKIFLSYVNGAGGVTGVAYTWGEVKMILRKAVDIDSMLDEYEEARKARRATETNG